MKFILLSFLILFSLPSQGQLHAELGLGMLAGSNSYNELNTGYSTSHNETLFAVGVGFMGRLGIKIANISITASGFYEWEGSSLKYQPSNQSLFASGTYAITNRRIGFGPAVIFLIPGIDISLIGEYYPLVSNTIQWAEVKSQNPFRQEDTASGSGFALGVGKLIFGKVHLQALYRSLYYNKVKLSGVETSVPGARFDKAHWGGMFVGGAYSF